MTAPARTAAFRALVAITADRADLPTALAVSRSALDDDRDRALTATIVTGSLRWRRALDHLVAHFAKRPLTNIDPDVLAILRLSLFQLLHLDRVPAAAVVDDAVSLTRAARKSSAAGFVNAVLRSMLRQRHRLPLPPRPGSPHDRAAALAYLGVTCSHPEWLVARWLDRYGFDQTEAWVQFNNEAAPLTVRANTLRVSREQLQTTLSRHDVETAPTLYAPDGLTVSSGNPLRTSEDGSFFVQDEASQLVPLVVDAQPRERILDVCASPGGKTTAMAAMMNDTGVLVACDVRVGRVALLRDTVLKSGARHAHVVHAPRRGPLPFSSTFDRVLVDAPCSGLGTIRRDPDIRWRREAGDLPRLAEQQIDVLTRAAETVRPGGRLVYATCSSEPEENEQVVDAFLERAPFDRLDLRESGPRRLASLYDDRGALRTLPFAHGLEAFFARVMVRRSVERTHGTIND
jgi:16S rRNA (cytosine967-C5)-methyltransferase